MKPEWSIVDGQQRLITSERKEAIKITLRIMKKRLDEMAMILKDDEEQNT